MKNLKPVNVMFETGVSDLLQEAVFEGIDEILVLAGVDKFITVNNHGNWRKSPYKKGEELIPYQSMDWYLVCGQYCSDRSNQLNAEAIMYAIWQEPWQQVEPHYDVVVLCSDIYADKSTNYAAGLAQPGLATIISVNRYLGLAGKLQFECIKTEIMHEVGHIFGLVPRDRERDIEENFGPHCTNVCVMRQGLRVPNDWILITRDRLGFGPFCASCRDNLREYFS